MKVLGINVDRKIFRKYFVSRECVVPYGEGGPNKICPPLFCDRIHNLFWFSFRVGLTHLTRVNSMYHSGLC